MPITASLGALKQNIALIGRSNRFYYYFETVENSIFNTILQAAGGLFIGGQNQQQKGLFINFTDFKGYVPNIQYSAILKNQFTLDHDSNVIKITTLGNFIYAHFEDFSSATQSVGYITPVNRNSIINFQTPSTERSFVESPWVGFSNTQRAIVDSTDLNIDTFIPFYYLDYSGNRCTVSRNSPQWSGTVPVENKRTFTVSNPDRRGGNIEINADRTKLFVNTTSHLISIDPDVANLPVTAARSVFGGGTQITDMIRSGGFIYVLSSAFGNANNASRVIKLTEDFDVIWAKEISSCELTSVSILTGSEFIIVAGRNQASELILLSFDLSGNFIWQNRLTGSVFDVRGVISTSSPQVTPPKTSLERSAAYVIGSCDGKGFITRLPMDVTLLSGEEFTIAGKTLKYEPGTQTISDVSSNPSTAIPASTILIQGPGTSNAPQLTQTVIESSYRRLI